jgi:hypothetical protein
MAAMDVLTNGRTKPSGLIRVVISTQKRSLRSFSETFLSNLRLSPAIRMFLRMAAMDVLTKIVSLIPTSYIELFLIKPLRGDPDHLVPKRTWLLWMFSRR